MADCTIRGRLGRDPEEYKGKFWELRSSLIRGRETPQGVPTGREDIFPLRFRDRTVTEALSSFKGDLVEITGNLHVDIVGRDWFFYISVKGMRNLSKEEAMIREWEESTWQAA